jgi:hypothetical protein
VLLPTLGSPTIPSFIDISLLKGKYIYKFIKRYSLQP